ncbi:hypothetical protein ABI59_21730 [Acidobacteria bacterium Mor1]|nr:hypothetical protein ABI59_21730 [Acidobacteria bacterium Mor1]
MNAAIALLAITESAVTQIKTVLMLVFFISFTGLVLWLCFSKSKMFQRASRIPLEDEPQGVDHATRPE